MAKPLKTQYPRIMSIMSITQSRVGKGIHNYTWPLKTQYPRIMSDADTVLHMKGPRSADDFLNPNTQEKSWSMANENALLVINHPKVDLVSLQ